MASPDGTRADQPPSEQVQSQPREPGKSDGVHEEGNNTSNASGQEHQTNGTAQQDLSGQQKGTDSDTRRPGESSSGEDQRPRSPEPQHGERSGSSRKRSRSGSLLHSEFPPTDAPNKPRETTAEKILLEQYLHREWQHAAMAASRTPHQDILEQKRAERDYYLSLRHERQTNPGAIFGEGYQGYGNARTDLKGQHPQLLYPSNRRRPGGRKARALRISKEDMAIQAEQPEDLVPIRLDIEWDKIKLRDTFTWNLHDRVTSPEIFAEVLVEDLGLPLESCGPLVRQIAQSIQDQLTDYYPQVFIEDEPLDPHLPYHAYKDDELRILIKLNITIGNHMLVDQFEWEINNPYNSPEDFARQMTRDLSLSGEFTTAIAHSIREQIQLFTKSLYITSHTFDGRPIEDPELKAAFLPSPLPSSFRPMQSQKEFAPYLYELNEADIERNELAISREQRVQKRSVNRRGGPALPDLKDRPRTIRTMIVHSVIPGAATSIEETRLFKRSGTGRSKRAVVGRDTGDDSDESDSDMSSAGSPAISRLAQGTARTRGMRSAASAAQNAMRATLGRSATPEVSRETRGRPRPEYREESVETEDKLVVKLKISPAKLRQLMNYLKSRPPGTAAATRGSMGPPQQPATATSAASGAQTPKRPTASQINGVVDAPNPPQPGVPGPPPPAWLTRGLENLRRMYPRDSFEGVMRYTAVDPNTGVPIPNASAAAATLKPGQKLVYKYFPRIRCHDCPGKLYTPGPAMTVDNFEVHLKNRLHKERVEERHARAREADAARGANGGSSAPAGNGSSAGDSEGTAGSGNATASG
ncbi:hypothetical protein VTO42DRAFT_3088 [Malbranchea cinnamomea]